MHTVSILFLIQGWMNMQMQKPGIPRAECIFIGKNPQRSKQIYTVQPTVQGSTITGYLQNVKVMKDKDRGTVLDWRIQRKHEN